jgi:hypothetical protein
VIPDETSPTGVTKMFVAKLEKGKIATIQTQSSSESTMKKLSGSPDRERIAPQSLLLRLSFSASEVAIDMTRRMSSIVSTQ